MFELTRKRKIAIVLSVDLLILLFSNITAYYFMKPFLNTTIDSIQLMTVLTMGTYVLFGVVFKVFTRMNRYTNLSEMFAILLTTISMSLVSLLGVWLIADTFSKRTISFIFLLSTFLIIMSRLTWRLCVEYKNKRLRGKSTGVKRTLVIGAGEGGKILINSIMNSPTAEGIQVVGFVDDDPNKQRIYLSGVRVLGTTNDLLELIEKYEIEMVTVAIPSLDRKKLRQIVDLLKTTTVKVNTMPSMEDIASGKVSISRLQNIDVVDLLGRDEVQLDMNKIKDQLTNQVILVTGAGGSIGSEICRQVMKFNPKTMILLGHGENSIYLIERELRNNYRPTNTTIIPVIADIQDRERIFEVMTTYQPQIVYHAAAHKHVPLMEYNPKEAVKNNIYGTKNVAEAAKANHVGQFVMVSTDKANNPPNVMGATKRVAELIVTGLNKNSSTKFSAVRFGNVLGSRGSVIPVFREQIAKGGPITITDFRMTRYFMTIPEASRLVIQSGALAAGGEIFVLDMGEPVKIVDLAKNMIRLSGFQADEIEIVESGIRPGEKLYEELLLDSERNDEQVFEKIFVGNITGPSLNDVLDFVENLPSGNKELAEVLVAYANRK
ncbi:polysaccharide biosynthesis protein [Enterococcus alcedinis]|uniref:Short-chain dehydrogenase n=1 Tax=Enterococcus alcedinis TaxID=1274384 RepID=A0A917JGZ6_9ENTE|nr:nucleoside-diphosphate sugar epimerase/dehydratase [Enterococcus alcedinis]MBP2102105.1 FlaA1/EpsC-like NDP-sugar epimerase [Enterococcus alcedinis]GGI65667.1 short-chain dehydrogenase [Enterococcus alcedinis]